MFEQTEERWALKIRLDLDTVRLCGKYCWDDATKEEPPIRTFRKRQEARDARAKMSSYRSEATVCKVYITYRHE